MIYISDNLAALSNELGGGIYVVGGYIRDYLLGINSNTDIDICGRLQPIEITKRLQSEKYAVREINERLGTVVICAKDTGESYEYTAFRREKYIGGQHVPSEIEFTDDIFEDARRRDFTVNAIYYDIENGVIIDPVGGSVDIKKALLRTADLPQKTFSADGLRIMRMCRIAAQLNLSIESQTFAEARRQISNLSDISAERKKKELDAILSADEKIGVDGAQYVGLKLLYESGAMRYVIPELCDCENVKQPSKYHRYDVLEHVFQTVKFANKSIRLAALLHDIAKPVMLLATGRMAGHDREGESMARNILRRLKYSNTDINITARLVGLHMSDKDTNMKPSKVRIIIAANQDIFQQLMQLKYADTLGAGRTDSGDPTVVKWQQIYNQMKEDGIPMNIKELGVTAPQLKEECGLDGKELGDALKWLLEHSLKVNKKLTKEQLIKEIKARGTYEN